jgi:hypothetical protein
VRELHEAVHGEDREEEANVFVLPEEKKLILLWAVRFLRPML